MENPKWNRSSNKYCKTYTKMITGSPIAVKLETQLQSNDASKPNTRPNEFQIDARLNPKLIQTLRTQLYERMNGQSLKNMFFGKVEITITEFSCARGASLQKPLVRCAIAKSLHARINGHSTVK